MTQDKLRRIITASASAITALIVSLLIIPIYQWISIAKYNKKIDTLRWNIAYLEQELEGYGDEPGLKDTLEYLKTEAALQKMYQELLELEGKK